MQPAATTTGWGDGDTLDVTLQRIADNDPTVTMVELSIGARHIPDGPNIIQQWSNRYTFIAHHTAPIGDNHSIRPTLNANPAAAAATLTAAGISRYSGHPPNRKHATAEQMWDWAIQWWETLAGAGIDWAVETMYVPRTRQEASDTGGYHLATPTEVWDFCERASEAGWEQPLLVDASHLHIGWCSGDWTEPDVLELIHHAPAAELHISTNDGRRDAHQVLTPSDRVWQWVHDHLDRYDIVVDEGRRHRNYHQPHVKFYSSINIDWNDPNRPPFGR